MSVTFRSSSSWRLVTCLGALDPGGLVVRREDAEHVAGLGPVEVAGGPGPVEDGEPVERAAEPEEALGLARVEVERVDGVVEDVGVAEVVVELLGVDAGEEDGEGVLGAAERVAGGERLLVDGVGDGDCGEGQGGLLVVEVQ